MRACVHVLVHACAVGGGVNEEEGEGGGGGVNEEGGRRPCWSGIRPVDWTLPTFYILNSSDFCNDTPEIQHAILTGSQQPFRLLTFAGLNELNIYICNCM